MILKIRDGLQLSIFSKRRTTFFSVGGWVRVNKSIFLVFFSPNSNIPRYVSCLDNIIHDHHFICSHDILFKYKNVFIKYPYDALFKYVRQKGFFVYSTWWNKITNQNEKRSDQGKAVRSRDYWANIREAESGSNVQFDVLQVCIQEFYTQCHHNEGCIKTVMLRGDIYSIPGFYHLTNGNHPAINTKHKRDFIS